MEDISKTDASINPLVKSIVKPFACGEVVDVGEAVYLASDNTIMLSDADAADTAQAIGIVVAIGAYGALNSVIGDMCDVCLYGPVTGYSGMTPGLEVFASTNPGAIEEGAPAGSSGDFVWSIGFAMSASTIFVRPYTWDIAAQ